MSFIMAIGWALLGAAATGILVTFWDEIRVWLNQVAADAVEKVFGYNARQAMHRAVARIDRVMDKVKNTATIYTKKNRLDTHFVKTDIVAEADVYEIDNRVLDEIQRKGSIVQEFEYKG
ncbi:hypothetical protein [Rossellomorea vietnamensis]|uniref:hypothetical protein n=1 Tax=Rossellomorea vietnamensis TaxID=218284 RepID=UPI001E64F348|nr:hypothetical protein [Rossellomorea vietnamensis]MCC5804671.1 hypothetical protein [Rossellomorea vietnamensis]